MNDVLGMAVPDWIDVWLDVMGEGGGEGAEGG